MQSDDLPLSLYTYFVHQLLLKPEDETGEKELAKLKKYNHHLWKFVHYLRRYCIGKQFNGQSLERFYNKSTNYGQNQSQFPIQFIKTICAEYSLKSGPFAKVKKHLLSWIFQHVSTPFTLLFELYEDPQLSRMKQWKSISLSAQCNYLLHNNIKRQNFLPKLVENIFDDEKELVNIDDKERLLQKVTSILDKYRKNTEWIDTYTMNDWDPNHFAISLFHYIVNSGSESQRNYSTWQFIDLLAKHFITAQIDQSKLMNTEAPSGSSPGAAILQTVTSITKSGQEAFREMSQILSEWMVYLQQEDAKKIVSEDVKIQVLSCKDSVENQFRIFLEEMSMEKYFDKFKEKHCCDMDSIDLFDDETLENEIEIRIKLHRKKILKKCIEIKDEMQKFKNKYGIHELLYNRLTKYGIVTLNIL